VSAIHRAEPVIALSRRAEEHRVQRALVIASLLRLPPLTSAKVRR
jgi:hypothetical protein